jgi:alpha-1,6-mannosyltransferase
VIGALIVVAVLAFACAPVLLSHDAFSYVDYARLGVHHGLNPYVNAPEAAPGDPAFAHVTWTETPSAYGPLFTLATYPLAWLPVWLAVAILKAVAAISVLGLAWLVSRLAAWRGVDPVRAAAFVALNPLVLVHVVGGAHNDGLAMLLATLGVAALVVGREPGAGASLVASAAIKSSSLFVAPFAVAAVRVAALLLLGLAVVWLLVRTWRGADWIRAAAWAGTGLLLATSWLLPWYLLWPLPLAAVARDRLLAAILLALTAYQLGARIPL